VEQSNVNRFLGLSKPNYSKLNETRNANREINEISEYAK